MERANAWELLREYNKDHFHLQHALTVEAVMRWFANDLGYGAEADYWGMVGLLHDIDFELYPEQHCVKCVELLQKGAVSALIVQNPYAMGYLGVEKAWQSLQGQRFEADKLIDTATSIITRETMFTTESQKAVFSFG